MTDFPLGRIPPTDDVHLARYPLTAATVPDKPTPVVLGVSWYEAFDRPTRDATGRWWIGRERDWGRVRGGHAICAKPSALSDPVGWWSFYDQGAEGACVGFASCRMMSLLNRERYDGFWLYRQAQLVDEWPGQAYDGTSVRAGLDVLRERGPVRVFRERRTGPDPRDGVDANRWAGSVDEVLACLHQSGAAGYVTLLNSWGRAYPHYVRLSLDGLARLLREDGEATIATDR